MRHSIVVILFFILSFTTLAKPIPIEAFTRHGDYLDMSLSPSGKHIAARLRVADRVSFVVLEVPSMKVVGGVKAQSGDEIHSVEWINDERLVYQFAEKRWSHDTPIPTGELFAINFDGSSNKIIFGYRAGEFTTGTKIQKRKATLASAEIISYLPGDKKNILIAEYPFNIEGDSYYNNKEKRPNIVRLNVYSGKRKKIDNIPFKSATPLANNNGEVNFVTYIDENYISQAAYRPSEDDEWMDLSDKLNGDYFPIDLSSDGKRVFLTGRISENQLLTMYEFDLDTQVLSPLFTDLQSDIEFYTWDPKLETPVIGTTFTNNHEYIYTSDKSDTIKWHKALKNSFDGQRVTIESQSKNGDLLLIHVSSEINPGEYYLFDTKAKGAQFLWANRSWLDPRTLSATKPFSFVTSDNLTVYGYVTLPADLKPNETTPFVTMIHGGPHGYRDFPFFDSEVQLLANRGYGVVQINYRGSGGYGSNFQQSGYKEWGGKMIQDILEGTQAAAKQFPLNIEKSCVYGASYGGYAAMMSVVRAPELFKCVIGYVGIYDLNYTFSESDTAEAYGGLAYLKRVLGEDQAVIDEFSPVNHASEIKAKAMIIHGKKDARVPVINATAMVKKLTEANNPPKYLNFSNSGHGVYGEEERKELYTALIEFLNENLQ
ncbi:S9 family peptidase [Alteromonas sp. 5E99-2]|uniref:alpha/beta hydrolase family protein n=1 Tax=Alteromonas sp. 5E99-2 TaxID=2817683 RepID=UPI001A99E17C|nr:prolyl oligopeptidase family serine peptidase [Alteromonas sp. 5E99-2]MBO1254730.1 S9 family peptidase [Alteromonas sp. 5E99-2]